MKRLQGFTALTCSAESGEREARSSHLEHALERRTSRVVEPRARMGNNETTVTPVEGQRTRETTATGDTSQAAEHEG